MMKAWVVIGESETGCWIVAAYKEHLPAETHVELATGHAQENGYHRDDCKFVPNARANPWDEQMFVGYGGVKYRLEQTELK